MPSITPIADRALDHLRAWYAAQPNFALMGEFNAGKSTLLNLLLGRSVLPESITATKLPVIWLSHGNKPESFGLTRAGALKRLDAAAPEPGAWEDFLVVRMVLDAPILRLCDVIDTPGISDPRLDSRALLFLGDFIDFGVWCTAAGQAWRQSEKAVWKAFPAALRDTSLLAVTRVDRLNGPAEVDKVIRRLRKDAKGFFHDIHPIASRVAMTAAADGKITDPDVWVSSGAADLMAGIRAAIKQAEAQCAARPVAPVPVEMAQATGADPAPDAAPLPEEDTTPDQPAPRDPDQIRSAFAIEREKLSLTFEYITFLASIEQLRTVIVGDITPKDAHGLVLDRCLTLTGAPSENPSRVFQQMEQEIEDFANGPWCRLA